jgi:hypothetical protein
VVAILVAVAKLRAGPDLVSYEDSRLDVSARVPESWQRQAFDSDLGLVTHTGFLVSNVQHTFRYPRLGGGVSTSAWDMGALPPNTLVIEVGEVVRFNVPCNSEDGNMRVTEFPLSLDEAETVESGPRYGAPPRLYIPICLDNGDNFNVNAWFFPQASDQDRELAYEMVSSVRPTS